MTKSKFTKTIIVTAICLLSACDQEHKEKSGTQVVAKVNNEEISIHQLNFVLSHSNGVTPENAEAAKKKILNNLVDVSILYQQAVAEKLDRDPDIMMSLEQSRRQSLAQAWLQKATKSDYKPSTGEIQVYYDEHPDLFSKHKTYKLKEVLISKEDGKQAVINGLLTTSRKVDELTKKLDEEKITYQVKQTVQGAENLPLEQLATLSSLKDGEFISYSKDNSVLILAVLAASEEHVDVAKASPVIEKFLLNKQHTELVEKTVKEVKDKAKVELLGEFGTSPATSSETAKP